MKISELRHKQKFLGLIAGIIIVCIISYHFAIKPTITEILKNKRITETIEYGSAVDTKISVSKQRLDAYNRMIMPYQIDSIKNHKKILETISNSCFSKGICIRNYSDAYITEHQDFELFTTTIVLESSLKKLLEELYLIEIEKELGRVSSALFERKTNRTTRKEELVLMLYLQNINFKTNNHLLKQSDK